ncbi:MAG TPA: hypothetical protein VN578_05400 [Candidatus Binatia bacterium]|jgi:hypothetical protein|nr:hypothetical protein [Candidatus Binatia bacterium]
MTDTQIEEILRKGPQPAPPVWLLKQLQSEITLAQPGWRAAERPARKRTLRRWLPALAFGLFLLSCLVIVGVQANLVGELKQQNQQLRAAGGELEQLRNQQARHNALEAEREELERLRQESDEVVRLRAEIGQLRGELGDLERLRSENEHLKAAFRRARASAPAVMTAAPAPPPKDEAEACVNNLKQVGLAIRTWALDNQDRYPTDIISCSNELSTVNVLICPGDSGKQQFKNIFWGQFRPEMVSYELSLSGKDESATPEHIIARCPIHQNVLFSDGSVKRGPGNPVPQRSGATNNSP